MTSTTTHKSKTENQRKTKDGATAVDAHVGGQLRAQRVLLGMSQAHLGDEVNLTFQQIQKYERGANRIAASRLLDFARILRVDVRYFFKGLTPEGQVITPPIDPDRILAKLMRSWPLLSDPQRTSVGNVVEEIVKTTATPGRIAVE